MNFLAHIYLSPENSEIILGNFIADSVKGKAIENYSPKIKQGILLHREIDSYTDQHAIFKQSKKRLAPIYRMYSGVIVDIFYDHFLCKLWDQYSDKDLKQFVASNYQMLVKKYKILPPRSKKILPYMIAQNWLANYSNLKDLRRVFKGMSRRTPNSSRMLNAVDHLEQDYKLYQEEFQQFFPELKQYVKSLELYNNI